MDSIKLLSIGILKLTFKILVPLLFINFGIYQEYYPLVSRAMDILYIVFYSDDIKIEPFSKNRKQEVLLSSSLRINNV